MGITIHYSGTLRSPQLIQPIISEVEDICKSMDWKFQHFDDSFPLLPNSFKNEKGEYLKDISIKGISMVPPESEPFYFTFTPEGRLVSFMKFVIGIDENNEMMGEQVHAKTQFAGPEIHMSIIRLLRYLSKKYFDEFEITDEAKYWETEDEKEVYRLFEFLTDKINLLRGAFAGEKNSLPKDVDGLVDKIIDIIKKLDSKDD